MTRQARIVSTRRMAGPAAALLLVAASAWAPGHAEETDGFAAEFAPYSDIPEAPPPEAGAVDISSLEQPGEEPGEDLGEDLGTGIASWYGPKFAGRRTASGERFDPEEMTAAHRSLPFGSMVRVTRLRTGRTVVVRINDRGPFVRERVIDLSQAAARALGIIRRGKSEVSLALLSD